MSGIKTKFRVHANLLKKTKPWIQCTLVLYYQGACPQQCVDDQIVINSHNHIDHNKGKNVQSIIEGLPKRPLIFPFLLISEVLSKTDFTVTVSRVTNSSKDCSNLRQACQLLFTIHCKRLDVLPKCTVWERSSVPQFMQEGIYIYELMKKCLLFVNSKEMQPLTWYTARQKSLDVGGELAQLENSEPSFLSSLMLLKNSLWKELQLAGPSRIPVPTAAYIGLRLTVSKHVDTWQKL